VVQECVFQGLHPQSLIFQRWHLQDNEIVLYDCDIANIVRATFPKWLILNRFLDPERLLLKMKLGKMKLGKMKLGN